MGTKIDLWLLLFTCFTFSFSFRHTRTQAHPHTPKHKNKDARAHMYIQQWELSMVLKTARQLIMIRGDELSMVLKRSCTQFQVSQNHSSSVAVPLFLSLDAGITHTQPPHMHASPWRTVFNCSSLCS